MGEKLTLTLKDGSEIVSEYPVELTLKDGNKFIANGFNKSTGCFE